MARRSYLARLARPLTIADPVVWSMPRASTDEARPTARAARPRLEAPADPISVPSPGEPTAVGQARSDRSPAPLRSPTPAPARLAKMGATTPGAGANAPGTRSTTPKPARPAPTGAPIVGHARPDPVTRMERPAPDRAAPRVGQSDVEAAPQVTHEPGAVGWPEISHIEPGPSVPSPVDALATARRIEAAQTHDRLTASAPEPQSRSPRPDAPATPSQERQTRLHIGAIEIRVTRPPTPAPAPPAPAIVHAPPAASAPLARAYTSRFGLAQS